jgi:ketosteroid isomerase-like protein
MGGFLPGGAQGLHRRDRGKARGNARAFRMLRGPRRLPPCLRDTALVSQENVEIIRRLFENADDVGAWFQAAAPDIAVYPRPEEPDAASEYHGLDGAMEYLINWFGQWDEYESEPIEILDAGTHVLVITREHGFLKRTGLKLEEDFSHSFVLREGKVVEWRMYDSLAEARAAVGLE